MNAKTKVNFLAGTFGYYLHVVHDDLEEPSQGAAFLLYTRIHFSTGSEKFSTSQRVNFYLLQKSASRQLFPNNPAEESIEDFTPNERDDVRQPGEKSGFKTNVRWKSGEIL